MSVDRNYRLRIASMGDERARQSKERKLGDAESTGMANENSLIFDVSVARPQGTGEFSSIARSVATLLREILGTEIDRIASLITKSGTTASQNPQPLQGNVGDKFESAAEIPRGPIFPRMAGGVSSNNASLQQKADPSRRFSNAATDGPVHLTNRSGEFAASDQTQVEGAMRRNLMETLSTIRETSEALLEQQQNNVTRQELSRELQTLRLVMEGRK